ncbi:GNAT family N-acetyltransferase [Thiotrichales bacterium 19S11-10]|nr:GNAT family N-acetyltransferase [Thiotrichales bacterium 19S11-10]MCF6807965.1 GNAT family N-acetyltransferase [Thiotrichales bacterium 19S9-11]MCF6811980.1 GNAT family N-acetyltransferase [Thiotrichales bacterium 19S9-12]
MITDIRQAKLTDIARLVTIENTMFYADRLSKRQFYYHINKKRNLLWVVENNIEIMGYMLVFMLKKNMRIYSLVVDYAYQGKGVAKQLLGQLINHPKMPCSIFLEVNTNNITAINLYKKFNFLIKSTLPSYYETGDSAYKMIYSGY